MATDENRDEMKEEIPEIAAFDPTMKKKKKKDDYAWEIKGAGLFSIDLLFSLSSPVPVKAGEQVVDSVESWLPIASIVLCNIHVQLEASISSGDLDVLQFLNAAVKQLSSTDREEDDPFHGHGSINEEY